MHQCSAIDVKVGSKYISTQISETDPLSKILLTKISRKLGNCTWLCLFCSPWTCLAWWVNFSNVFWHELVLQVWRKHTEKRVWIQILEKHFKLFLKDIKWKPLLLANSLCRNKFKLVKLNHWILKVCWNIYWELLRHFLARFLIGTFLEIIIRFRWQGYHVSF